MRILDRSRSGGGGGAVSSSIETADASVNSGASYVIPDSCGDVVRITLTATCTITLPTLTLATNQVRGVEVRLLQNGTGGYTVTWAAPGGYSILWDYSGVAPSLNTGANKSTWILFRYLQGSTVIAGQESFRGA